MPEAKYQTILWLKDRIKEWEDGHIEYEEMHDHIKMADSALDDYMEQPLGIEFGELTFKGHI